MASGKEDTAIPREMLARARAIAVFPQVKKGAVIVGGRHGQGVMSVKRPPTAAGAHPPSSRWAAAASACSSAAR